jgi:predicted aspartyl protease
VPGHRLALYPKRDARCTHPIGWTGAFETVSLARDGDRLLADAELDGHAVSALIDTGARWVIVNADAAARIGLDTKVLGAEPGGMAGGVDPHEVLYHWHRFATLRIGQETLRDPVLTVAPLQERADVLLGASWFATHRVWLSYADARMFVQAVRDRAPIR